MEPVTVGEGEGEDRETWTWYHVRKNGKSHYIEHYGGKYTLWSPLSEEPDLRVTESANRDFLSKSLEGEFFCEEGECDGESILIINSLPKRIFSGRIVFFYDGEIVSENLKIADLKPYSMDLSYKKPNLSVVSYLFLFAALSGALFEYTLRFGSEASVRTGINLTNYFLYAYFLAGIAGAAYDIFGSLRDSWDYIFQSIGFSFSLYLIFRGIIYAGTNWLKILPSIEMYSMLFPVVVVALLISYLLAENKRFTFLTLSTGFAPVTLFVVGLTLFAVIVVEEDFAWWGEYVDLVAGILLIFYPVGAYVTYDDYKSAPATKQDFFAMKKIATDTFDEAILSKKYETLYAVSHVLDDLCDGLRLASEEELAKYVIYSDQIDEIKTLLSSAASADALDKLESMEGAVDDLIHKDAFWEEMKAINEELKFSMEKSENIRFSPLLKAAFSIN